jgi:hypothetical protein
VFVRFLSHCILTMSNSKQPPKNDNALDAIVCRNPFCSRGQKSFATEAALQKHLAVLPQCTRFLLNQAPSQWAFQQPPRTSVDINCAQGIVNTSHKRKCVLRRDVVNNIDPAYLHTDYETEPRQDVAFLPAGIIDADDDDEYDDNANGWEDYCLVVKAPTVQLTHHTFMQKWTIDLLKVLDDMNAPDYAFGDILSWARGASNANYSFNPSGGLSRSKSVDLLFDAMPNACQLLPTVVPIMTGDFATSNVVVFDFVRQLLSL